MAAELDNAISAAVETHEKDLPAEQTTQGVQKDTSESKEETPTNTETTKTGDPNQEEALRLYNALKDPAQAPVIVDMLARAAGYSKVETKQEVKEVKNTITDILKESLGEEYAFLVDKLAPGLEKILQQRPASRDEEIEDIRARVEEREKQDLQRELAVVHTDIAKEYFGTDDMPENVLTAMEKAMEDFPPSQALTPKQWYTKIFNLVAGELRLQPKTSSNTRERAERSRNDVPAKLQTRQNGVTPVETPKGMKKMTLTEAVNAAALEVEKQLSK